MQNGKLDTISSMKKRLPFSAKDFADYLVKYDASCECDAFNFPNISESRHEKLLDFAGELMNSMGCALDAARSKHFSSLEELFIQLDLHTSQYKTSKRFWMTVFKEVAKQNLAHWLIDDMLVTPSIVADCLKAGLLDKYVKEDNLCEWLDETNMAGDNRMCSGASILEISRAWCKRKSKLEKREEI